MSDDQPGLFDLPGHDLPSRSDRPRPGKNRETWACTVTAEVTVVDAEALRDAAEHAQERAVAIGCHADPAADDPEAEATGDSFDILAWLVWPTAGLEDLLEADALRILGVETEVLRRRHPPRPRHQHPPPNPSPWHPSPPRHPSRPTPTTASTPPTSLTTEQPMRQTRRPLQEADGGDRAEVRWS